MPAIKISPSHETQKSAVTVRHKNTHEYNDYDDNSNIMLGLGSTSSYNDESEYEDHIGFEEVLEEDDDDDDDDDDDNNNDTSNDAALNKDQQDESSRKKWQYHGKEKQITQFEREELIPALAIRSCHVPGNNVCTDYLQHMANIHPVFGICCHNKLHPVGTRMRLWNLFSSIMFGLTITNCMWLWFFSHGMISDPYENHPSIDPSKAVFDFHDKSNWTKALSRWTDQDNNSDGMNGTDSTNITSIPRCNFTLDDGGNNETIVSGAYVPTSVNENVIHVNQGMIILWTLGCSVHALYDVMIWYLEVCSCCPRKHPDTTVYHRTKYQQCGTALVILTTLLCAVTATLAILLRASIIANNEAIIDSQFGKDSSSSTNVTDSPVIEGVQDSSYRIALVKSDASVYEFLLSYFVELLLALFVFLPLVETVLFSGILGCCGLIPFLGGRPYEVKQAYQRRLRRQEQEKQQQLMGLDVLKNDQV
jgi:hypothetical protein